MESLKERIKAYYGLDEEGCAELLREPSSLSFPDVSSNPEARKAKARIEEAIARQEKTLLYGDYDTDGILGTSIFLASLLKKGLRASYFIPSRYKDGYGLTLENAKRIAASGYRLVILIDNGVSCFEQVAYLSSKGIDVLIFDHHELPDRLPPALALVHPIPLSIGKKGGFNISAGFVCYLFSLFLNGEEDPYLRTLAGITTLSDMMPLLGINRDLVRLALRDLKENRYPEITTLCPKKRIDEKVLGMEIIPCINAIGRMEEGHRARLAVSYFAERDERKREGIASWMKECNEGRKRLTKEAVGLVKYKKGTSGIVANLPLKEGLNGLLANRMMKENGVPCAIFSPSFADPNVLVGSIRAEEGFDVLDCLKELGAYCLTSGGHAHAGGLTILSKDYPSFSKAFLSYCREHPFIKEEPSAIPLALSEANMDSFRLIREFGPFGEGFPEPLFLLTSLKTDAFQYSADGKYLMTPLGYGVRLISFSYGRKDFLLKDKTSFYVNFELNEYKGRMSLQLRVASPSNK